VRSGWTSRLSRLATAALLFLTVTGLAVTVAPFHPAVQWGLLLHTAAGIALLLPLCWYYLAHWLDYRHYAMSHIVLLGYVGLAAVAVCLVSGVVVTWQGLFGVATSWTWRQVHLWSTLVTLAAALPHAAFTVVHLRRRAAPRPVGRLVVPSVVWTAGGALLALGLAAAYPGERYVNAFPADYNLLYGPDRPFAPSLARTASGGAFDPRSLSGSASCGTAGCHEQIVAEWRPSAHRYAARDTLFQKIQGVMAEQNGAESTRYCAGCHDPISLFSGNKNLFAERLTGSHGWEEGVSCLACHAIRETDVKGNANYTVTQAAPYLWQWQDAGTGRLLRDFLIRTYPAEHGRLSKRMFKAPEYCAACHKQFIDQEINRVGWVQLQNQYDNWAASHWNKKGDARRTVECRECHMPLVDSTDPAAGDAADYNRSPGDGKHRSHRFIASNQLMPRLLELEGWERQVELTERWLQGRLEIPEIRDKWAEGPIVQLALDAPERVAPGEAIPLRVVMTSTKVGHDYPTGPLDIIQSWIDLRVTDEDGRALWSSGATDQRDFIEPGSFLFKAEPIDQHGNLIDRHNLWEMVGVRYRRALFPGYSDTVEYRVPCAAALAGPPGAASTAADPAPAPSFAVPAPERAGHYAITATLRYRKVDQFLLNFFYGEDSGVTAPITDVARASARVQVLGR